MSTEPDKPVSQSSTPEAPESAIPTSLANSAAPSETPPPGEQQAEPSVVEGAAEPLTWDKINLPEGFEVEDTVRDSFLEVMNDDKLSGAERAQKLVDLQTNFMQKAAEVQYQQWADLQTSWQDAVRADPEIGGDKLEPALGEISKLVDKYGSPELRQALDLTGAGNNPHVVKFLSKVAKELSEGGPVLGAPAQAKESLADRIYPSMKPKGA